MMRLVILLLSFLLIFSCATSTTKKEKAHKNQNLTNTQSKIRSIPVDLTVSETSQVIGEPVNVSFKTKLEALPDSIRMSINSIYWKTFFPETTALQLIDAPFRLGKNNSNLTFYWSDTLQASKTLTLVFNSDISPLNYTYKVEKSYPHDTRSFTQGLEFSEGFLYEGTGQYGESKLFKLDLDNGGVVQSINLPDNVFGEGITLMDNKIYQLSWQNQVGFVYNKNTFELLYEFSYPTEGWGLTNNGKELIMSDGSEIIYFLDTDYIQEIRRIQVYDNQGPVKNLNELEYIKGEIFANVYGSDFIVAIDPVTGKVTKRIDLSNLLNRKHLTQPVDVLNGIAYNPDSDQLIVTGKWWPRFFHISLRKK
ncbi:MAG: glutaminyl-peptide cyclotransferase [Salinivirgaceae bacterium]|jgi:glutamine cyclotransferase